MGRPGMNEMAPSETTMKPAPADTYASLTVTVNPDGAPSFFASSESEYCVLDMQMGSARREGSASYLAMRDSAPSVYTAPAPPYTSRTTVSIFSLTPCVLASYKWRNLSVEGALHAAITACPSASAPAPPCAKCSAVTASKAPPCLARCATSSTSASVSVWKRLIATTTLTPCFLTLLMCASMLAAPLRTRSRASTRYTSASAAPGTTPGASHEWSLSARTVQTSTAHEGRSPE
mmetsp:Transcript_60201/g.138106  ORF Transcript_60201/g.138106 Transcript_60201/m.138106 type:complete len:234 (+) Transcript_60201:683-1384(+)